MLKKDPSAPQITPTEEVLAPLVRPAVDRLVLNAAFYANTSRAVVDCCGHEVGTPDYHSVLDMLNTRLHLGLDALDRTAFSLMLTGLSNSRRFAGEIHIDSVQGENSAAHSCHAVVLGNEIVRRAGLLAPERASAETDELRRSISIGCFIHDMGEILGELSSLAQRNANHSLEELPDIEREIFRITLSEAYRAASAEPSDPATFYAFVRELRDRAGLSKHGIAGTSPEAVAGVLKEFSQRQETSPLDGRCRAAVQAALMLYDMAELKGSVTGARPLFIGNAVKVVEHLQGLRHFMRFAKVDRNRIRLHLFSPETHTQTAEGLQNAAPTRETVPLQYVSSRRFLNNVKYIEKELPRLFQYASSPEEKSLAGALRDAAYQTQIEWFSISRNFIDRTPTSELSHLVKLQTQLGSADSHSEKIAILRDLERLLDLQIMKDRELFRKGHSRAKEDPRSVSQLLSVESRGRIVALYQEALHQGFEPKSETPLLLLDEVPAELRGFLCRSAEPSPVLPPRPSLDHMSPPASL
jgi:hypothetical protein